jgi:hypothetical protein
MQAHSTAGLLVGCHTATSLRHQKEPNDHNFLIQDEETPDLDDVL